MRQELEAANIDVHTFPSGWTVLTMHPDHSSNSKKLLGKWIDVEWDPRAEHYMGIAYAAVPSLDDLGKHPMIIMEHQTIVLGPNLQTRSMINRVFYTALAQCAAGPDDCPMTPAHRVADVPEAEQSPASSTETGESVPYRPHSSHPSAPSSSDPWTASHPTNPERCHSPVTQCPAGLRRHHRRSAGNGGGG